MCSQTEKLNHCCPAIICPICGKNMFTHREWTLYRRQAKVLYKCQTKRADKTACDYKDVKKWNRPFCCRYDMQYEP